jgi:hypothetical protein
MSPPVNVLGEGCEGCKDMHSEGCKEGCKDMHSGQQGHA